MLKVGLHAKGKMKAEYKCIVLLSSITTKKRF